MSKMIEKEDIKGEVEDEDEDEVELDDFYRSELYDFMLSKVFTMLKYFHKALKRSHLNYYIFKKCDGYSLSQEFIAVEFSRKELVDLYFTEEYLTKSAKMAIYMFLEKNSSSTNNDTDTSYVKISSEDLLFVLDAIGIKYKCRRTSEYDYVDISNKRQKTNDTAHD